MQTLIGDGIADDTVALQALIDATPAGEVLLLPTPINFYKITTWLKITKPIFLTGSGVKIQQTVAGRGALLVTSSYVTISNLILTGMKYLTQGSNEFAINVLGPVSHIEIVDNIISTWGFYGIFLKSVSRFTIQDNLVSNIFYGGIVGQSISHGAIDSNTVENIMSSPNAYGIAASRVTDDLGELTTQPNSSFVTISNNVVRNVPHWEGIDSHSGQNITITGNTVTGTKYGINVGPSNNAAGVSTYAPKNIVIRDNVLDHNLPGSTIDPGFMGIGLSGAAISIGTALDVATGQITGNTISNYGDPANSLSGSIYSHDTQDVAITDNVIRNPINNGMNFYYNNFNLSVERNIVQNPSASTLNNVKGIYFASDYNQGTAIGNTISAGPNTGAVTFFGIYRGTYPHDNILTSNNTITGATYPIYPAP